MIWVAIGERPPTDDELERLWHACRRHRVVVLRVVGSSPFADAVHEASARMEFNPTAQPPSLERCWVIERWGPTVKQAVYGERMHGVTVEADGPTASVGRAKHLVWWPDASMDVLSAVRDTGTVLHRISALVPVDHARAAC